MEFKVPILYDVGEPVDACQLEISQLSEHFYLGWRFLRAPLSRLTEPAGDDDDLHDLLSLYTAVRDICREAAPHLEPSFLQAEQYRQQLLQESVRREIFLVDFRDRLAYVGTDVVPQAWSHLGWLNNDPRFPVALSRDSGLVILVAGIQGSGKTVFSSVLCECCLHRFLPISSADTQPTCFAFFHLEEQDRLPQLLDGLKKNPTQRDLDLLLRRLGVHGTGLTRVRLVAPEKILEALMPRLWPYLDLGLEVMPIKVQLGQLGQPGLEAALGAESEAHYIQRMLEDAQDQGRDLCIEKMHKFIETAEDLNQAMKRPAHARLRILQDIAARPGEPGMWQMYEPGVATVAYLGGPHMTRRRMVAILVALLGGLVMPSPEHGAFQRVIVADEVDLLADEPGAWAAFTRIARVVRHRGAMLALMGQDLLKAPDELFGLAGLGLVFQLRNPRVFEFLRDRLGALSGARFKDVLELKVGEALMGATAATVPWLQQTPMMVGVRPLLCEHGGRTRSVS